MTTSFRSLLLVTVAAIAVCGFADAYSVAHHLPYDFGGHGRADRVAADWPSHGTALGPPLLPFVLLVVGAALLSLPGRWGRVGDVVLLLVGAMVLVGTVGEPSTWHSTAPVQVLFRLATVVVCVGLLLTSVRDWRGRGRVQSAGLTSPVS